MWFLGRVSFEPGLAPRTRVGAAITGGEQGEGQGQEVALGPCGGPEPCAQVTEGPAAYDRALCPAASACSSRAMPLIADCVLGVIEFIARLLLSDLLRCCTQWTCGWGRGSLPLSWLSGGCLPCDSLGKEVRWVVEERQGPGVRHTHASPLPRPTGTTLDRGPFPDPANGNQENTGCVGK